MGKYKRYYSYDDDDDDDTDVPYECYGKDWDNEDDVCAGCEYESDCRKKCRSKKRRGRTKVAKRRYTRTADDEALDEAREYDEIMDRMPRDGEHWAERVAKNSASGMLSAFGREIMLFFKKWRW